MDIVIDTVVDIVIDVVIDIRVKIVLVASVANNQRSWLHLIGFGYKFDS